MKPTSIVAFEILKEEERGITIPRLHRQVVARAGMVSQQTVRAAIKRLTRAGLVEECGLDHSTHPPARVYCLTEAAKGLGPEQVFERVARKLPKSPALSDEDLEAIRQVVREELARVAHPKGEPPSPAYPIYPWGGGGV